MTVRISASIHFDPADVHHEFKSGPGGYATLDIGKPGDTEYYLHFKDRPELIRVVIAHLAELENEMLAALEPVIANSARDCDEQNPDGSGEHCHRGGDHGVHQDSNGDEWRTDGATDLVMDAAGGYADELVVDAGGHVYDATGDGGGPVTAINRPFPCCEHCQPGHLGDGHANPCPDGCNDPATHAETAPVVTS